MKITLKQLIKELVIMNYRALKGYFILKRMTKAASKQTHLTPKVETGDTVNKPSETAAKQGAERMLETLRVKAVLTRPVSFQTQDGKYDIPENTEIVVDPEKNIGLYDNVHFDLLKEEYKVLYLN